MGENSDESYTSKSERIQVKKLVSKRDIGIEAFELVNGILMLEATFLDPYHLIRLNLHIDPNTREILASKSEFANYPHSVCPSIAKKAKELIGLKIQRGITREIITKIGGSDGCVHLRELVMETINFAATALIGYDEGFGLMSRDFNVKDEKDKFGMSSKALKNTCFVYKDKDIDSE